MRGAAVMTMMLVLNAFAISFRPSPFLSYDSLFLFAISFCPSLFLSYDSVFFFAMFGGAALHLIPILLIGFIGSFSFFPSFLESLSRFFTVVLNALSYSAASRIFVVPLVSVM